MIISHTHKFILLKSLKTAGTSVEAALSQACSGPDVVTPLNDFSFNQGEGGALVHRAMNAETLSWWDKEELGQHVDVATLRRNLPAEAWNTYYKISIARNPWDRVVSLFAWSSRNDPSLNPRKRFYHRLGIAFDEMREIRPGFRKFVEGDWETNDRFYTIDGELCVDFVIRYENLLADLDILRTRLGLPDITLPRLKTGFRPGQVHYSRYYDEETKILVARRHHNDIRLFGYTFTDA
jgi:hypothetical protein